MTRTRAAVLRRVKSGALTPAIADRLAAKKQKFIGLLAHEPPSEQFDPMQKSHWTLAMALAWAIWRTPDKVREFWNEWRLQKYEWQPVKDKNGEPASGFTLGRLKAVSLHDVWWTAANSFGIAADRERDRLWTFLGGHRLEASAADSATGKPIVIPHTAWPHIGVINYYEGDEDSVSDLLGLYPLYLRVMLPRDGIIGLWPPVGKPESVKARENEQLGGSAREVVGDTVGVEHNRADPIPAVQRRILNIFDKLWPDGQMPPRVKTRDHMILKNWPSDFGKPPDPRTIRRAFAKRTKSDN